MNTHITPTKAIARGFAVIAAIAVLSGCAGFKVETDQDAAADFSKFQTYAWTASQEPDGSVEASDAAVPDSPDAAAADSTAVHASGATEEASAADDLARRIRASVDANLAAKGFRLVPVDQADLLVSHRTDVAVKQRRQDTYYSFYSVEIYEEGTLEIRFTDTRTSASAWKGDGRAFLRTVGGANGGTPDPPRMFRDPPPRKWPVEKMIDSILAGLPRAGTGDVPEEGS